MPDARFLPLREIVRAFVADKTDTPLTPEQELEQAAEYANWRVQVAGRLMDGGRFSESVNFAECGHLFGNFQVIVCENDPGHEARALPFTCHLRYCPECERRHSAELVAKYVPILKAISEQDDRSTWSLKKIVLTTPYNLAADSAVEDFQDAWEAVERWQQLMLADLLQHELTDGEKRRGRVDYTKHGYGSMISAEFGGKNRYLHFHMLAWMPFLDKHKSSDFWLQASGGEAEITYIARVNYHDVDDQVREQVKYITKFQELPPALVVRLADVLDGSRRIRTYGTVRGAKPLDEQPHVCSICASKFTIMRCRAYYIECINRNVTPDESILAAARLIGLDLIPGIKVGEAGGRLARDDPDEPPAAAQLPGFDAVFTPKKPFRYD